MGLSAKLMVGIRSRIEAMALPFRLASLHRCRKTGLPAIVIARK
jgi:hypothetical protein